MSIIIESTFQIKSKKNIKNVIDKIANNLGATVNHQEDASIVNFCVMGNLTFQYCKDEKTKMATAYSNTWLCGPGFHHAVIAFLDKLAESNPYKVTIKDETGYCKSKDFDSLCGFYRKWLTVLMTFVYNRIKDNDKDMLVCWDSDWYIPKRIKGTVITPMGRYSSVVLYNIISGEQQEDICKSLFIWNNIEKDAYFYRNTAIHRIWLECYFEPSQRYRDDSIINKTIISDIERAASLSNNIRLPIIEYLELCNLDGKEPLEMPCHSQLDTGHLGGYRKEPVTHKHLNICFTISGNMIYGNDMHSDVYFDALNTLRVQGMFVENHELDFYEDDTTKFIKSKNIANGSEARLYYIDEENDNITYQCQIIMPGQYYLFTIACENTPEEVNKFAEEVFKSIRYINN